MTVGELINILKKYPEDMRVIHKDDDFYHNTYKDEIVVITLSDYETGTYDLPKELNGEKCLTISK